PGARAVRRAVRTRVLDLDAVRGQQNRQAARVALADRAHLPVLAAPVHLEADQRALARRRFDVETHQRLALAVGEHGAHPAERAPAAGPRSEGRSASPSPSVSTVRARPSARRGSSALTTGSTAAASARSSPTFTSSRAPLNRTPPVSVWL